MTDTPTTPTPSPDAGKAALAEIVAGLDGVTAGPWASDVMPDATIERLYQGFANFPHSNDITLRPKGQHPHGAWIADCGNRFEDNAVETAAHLARCDPDTIRAIASYVSALEAAVAEAEKMCDEFDAMNDARHRAVMALETRALAAETERDRMRPWAALGETVMEGWPETGDIELRRDNQDESSATIKVRVAGLGARREGEARPERPQTRVGPVSWGV